MDVNTATVERVFSAANAELMIHGHTHRPGIHQHLVDGRPRTRVVLDAWYDGGQSVRVEGGRIEERRFGAAVRPVADLSESGTAHPAQ
jgi:UDP-2,3-diacylglucosamine hydrolase